MSALERLLRVRNGVHVTRDPNVEGPRYVIELFIDGKSVQFDGTTIDAAAQSAIDALVAAAETAAVKADAELAALVAKVSP